MKITPEQLLRRAIVLTIVIASAALWWPASAQALRIKEVAAVPHPILLFFFRQPVEVQHRFPMWRCFSIFFERCAPPEAAHVLVVAPEIIVMLAALLDVWDSFL